MRIVIAVANLKGGVGKTTTAVYLAGASRRISYGGAILMDADPQASASEWFETTPIPNVTLIEAPTVRLIGRQLEQISDGLIIIDTPPGAGDEKIVRSVVEQADVIVIPTRAGGTEPTRVQAMLDIIPETTPRGIILCAARTGTRDVAEMIELWEEAGEKVWGTIPERVSIAGAASADLSVIGLVCYDGVLRQAIAAAKRRRR